MTTVVVGKEKNSNPVYATWMACLISRYNEGVYSYDGPELQKQAEAVINTDSERAARMFLHERSDYEYEGVEEETVIE